MPKVKTKAKEKKYQKVITIIRAEGKPDQVEVKQQPAPEPEPELVPEPVRRATPKTRKPSLRLTPKTPRIS